MDADGLIAEFGTYLDEGSARVFVGAGLSRAAGYPDWQELTKTFRQELGFRKMDDLPQLAQYYQDNVAGGRPQSTTTSPRPFKPRPLKPTRSHQLLGELPGVVYWTTNDDSLVESAINDAYPITEDQQLAQHVPPAAAWSTTCTEASTLPSRGRPGGNPPHIVLTRDDFERYPTTHPRAAGDCGPVRHQPGGGAGTRAGAGRGPGRLDRRGGQGAMGGHAADFDAFRLGGTPVRRQDFDLLMHPDVNASAAAAVSLLQQALFRTGPV